MNAKKIIEELNAKGVKFVVYTDVAYGRGINGVGYNVYCVDEEFGDGTLKTHVHRTFEPKDDHLVIIEDYTPPKIPWNRAAEKEPYTRKVYIGYEHITYIKEIID